MGLRTSKSCLLSLLVIVCCSSILALDTGERRAPYSSIDDTRQPSSQASQQQRLRLPRRLSSRHNELGSTEPGKKTSHLLVAGHLRTETTLPETSTTTLSPTSTRDKDDSSSDDTLLLSSAGNGKERKGSTASTSSDDDDKKTLSQQVKEGKYGLIQNEIFPEKPKRPGIISYSSNPEVPYDSAKNLGGLDEEEIWLAENHVLVLKGGNFPDSDAPTEQSDNSWPPIDDYKAPRRQVKIPPRPKVPPPFPVQLLENGPIQLIGTNGTSLIENGTIDFEALPGGFKGFLPGEGPYFPFPTINVSDVTGNVPGSPEKKNKAEGALGPFYPALPPGAVIVPPPSNQTDYDDEDQSIYYPPPYSFIYPQDNSTAIPPGPLVPGIILPPPPDFFSSLDDSKQTTKDKYSKRPSTTPIPPYLPPRKSSTKLYKTSSVTTSSVGSKTASYNPKPFSRTKLKNSTYNRYQTDKTTGRAYQTIPFIEVTTPTSVRPTTLENPDKYHIQQILENQVIDTSTEKAPWRGVVNNKAVPLVTFFATTTPSSVDQPVETTPSSINNILTTENPTRYPSQASYYFYEEANNEETPSSTADPVVFFSTTAQTPPYYKLDLPQQEQPREEEKKEYYDVETIPSQQTSKDYSVKLIDSIVKDPQIYRYLDSGATNSQEKFETPPVRNQSPRMLHSEPLYYQPVPTRSSPKLSYFTTPKPNTYYRKPDITETFAFDKPTSKSKPIYQYSFEATNYSKRGGQSLTQVPQIQAQQQQPQIQQPRRQKELPLYNEFQDIQTVSDQYDYVGSEVVADQHVQTEKVPYVSKKKERTYYQHSTTASPIRDTTLASHQQYFTKQDEQLLDDVTKEYFTMFGKKLSGKLPSTTPIYGKSSVTERPAFNNVNSYVHSDYTARQPSAFRSPNIKVHYGDQTPGPYSMKGDILVNYKNPLAPIDPNSEFISVVNPTQRPATLAQKYKSRPVIHVDRDYALPAVGGSNRHRFDQTRGYNTQRIEQHSPREPAPFVPISDPREAIRGAGYRQRPVSLAGDIAVNYKNPRPSINPDAEFIGGGIPSRLDSNVDKANSYFAYRLPGDGGHFYFLTPHAISREDSNGGYLYSRPRGSRLLRRRRGRDGD